MTCPSVTLRHPRFCQLADPTNPAYKPSMPDFLKSKAEAGCPVVEVVNHVQGPVTNDDKALIGFAPGSVRCCGSKAEEPALEAQVGLLGAAVNFTKAVVRHVGNGMKFVPEDVRVSRLKTCQACPLLASNGVQCSVCECVVSVKTRWDSESCPEGKW